MKSSKFSSIEELKAEVQAKADSRLPVVATKAMVKYQAKKATPEKIRNCNKHGFMHQQCAAYGIQRTKFKRWQRTGDRVFASNSYISDSDMDKMEEAYAKAKKAFHEEPCTCHSSN